jgi:hypothetical protein
MFKNKKINAIGAILIAAVTTLGACAEQTDGCIGGLQVTISASGLPGKIRVQYATQGATLETIYDECSGQSSSEIGARNPDGTVILSDTQFGGQTPTAYSLLVQDLHDCQGIPTTILSDLNVPAAPEDSGQQCTLSVLTRTVSP